MLRALLSCGLPSLLFLGCGQAPLQPRDPDPGAFHFTIETYNLNNEDGGNPTTVAAIGESGADVICLQEVTDVWQAAIETRYSRDYPHRLFRIDPSGGAAGLGILSRFPIEDAGFAPAPNSWHPAWNYAIETPNGSFFILNTHLRNATSDNGNTVQSYLRTDEDHRLEIAHFTDKCAPFAPAIVLGDFNEGVNGAAIGFLEQNGYRNALPLYHPGQPTWRYGRTVGGQFTQTLDHILFSAAFEPLNSWVVNGGGSDHLPVVAHLEALHRW